MTIDPAITPSPAPSAQPLLSRLLLLFMLAMILANIAGHMHMALLPLYLRSLNASVAQVGLFFTLSQIVPLALQILGGWVSDSLGRLRSIALGSLAGVLSYFGLVLAPTWQWVLLGEGLGSLTRSLVGPSFDAFVAEQSSETNRARVFGITQTLFMIVTVIGPPLGGWLAGRYGFKAMLFIAGLLYTCATVIRVGMARAAARGREAHPRKLTLSGLRANLGAMGGLIFAGGLVTWILLTDGVRDVAFALSFNLMPIYLEDIGGLSLQQIGWLNSVFGLFVMLTTIPAGWLADKRGERLSIAAGFLFISLGIVLLIQAGTFVSFAAAWAVFGIGVGMVTPAYQSLISKAVPERLRGTAFGLFSTSLGLISLPAPTIGAQLWGAFGPRAPFAITAAAALFCIFPVWAKFRLPSAPETGEGPTTDRG